MRSARTGRGDEVLTYPRSYADLLRFAERHSGPPHREAVVRVARRVQESGWIALKKRGGADLVSFYEAATEVFHEVTAAVIGVRLLPAGGNILLGEWTFTHPVDDIVLNLLHARHPESRVVILDGPRAYVRDGCGVYMERAERYLTSRAVAGAAAGWNRARLEMFPPKRRPLRGSPIGADGAGRPLRGSPIGGGRRARFESST